MGRVVLIFCWLLLPSLKIVGQDCEDLKWTFSFLQENHLNPIELESKLLDSTIYEFFNMYDPAGYYLDRNARNQIVAKQELLLEDIKSGECDFLNYLVEVISQREDQLSNLLTEDAFWNFDYSETRRFNKTTLGFEYQMDITEQWRCFVQMETLLRYHEIGKQGLNKDQYLEKFDSLKTEIRAVWDCRIKKTERREIRKHLYQSVLSGFDQYTEYFDKKDVTELMSALSSDLYGLGFFVTKDFKSDVIVSEVISGSSADVKGLEIGDQIISFFKGTQEIDLFCYDSDEINNFLIGQGDSYFTVNFRSNDLLDTVILYKERLDTEVKSVQSFLLKGNKRIGYISVPSFYYRQENGGNSVSDDVARAIFKLRRNKIDGLILGLQGNGGGSIEEALGLASLFIDEGSMLQLVSRESGISRIKDPIRGMSYYGPLMILVDGMSASASELLAMVLMEQKRALIVGDTTYGKNTTQTVVPIGKNITEEPEKLLKFTGAVWYNLRGYNFHGIGITPDIGVPSFGLNEKRKKSFDKIKSILGDRQNYFEIPAWSLQTKSRERFSNSIELNERRKAIRTLSTMMGSRGTFSLSYQNFDTIFESIKVLDEEIKQRKFEIELMDSSESNGRIISWLKRDLLLVEGYNIFEDWLTYLKR